MALAHHREDQAETFLIQLLRGSRPQGMRALGPGPLWRPLLGCSRLELRSWLQEQGLSWREDPSNQDPHYLRVRLRQEVFPLLEEIRPGVTGTLAERARWQAEEEEVLSSLAGDVPLSERPGGGWEVSTEPLRALPEAIRTRVLVGALGRLLARYPTQGEVIAAGEILEAGVGAVRDLEGGARLLKVSGALAFLPEGEARLPESGVPVVVPGRTLVPGLGAEVVVRWRADAGQVPPGLQLRRPRTGDRFRPRSLGGRSKRLARYLRDRGLDRAAREGVALVAAEDRILWVLGHEPAWEEDFQELGLELEIMW